MAISRKGVAENATLNEVPDTASIELFIVAAEMGSLAKTAEKLGISVSTASRRLEKFEEVIGGSAFERLHSGLQLTALGIRALPAAQKVQKDLIRLLSASISREPRAPRRRSVVTIGAPEGLGAFWIARFVAVFQDLYPETILCFETRSVLGAERKRPPDVIVSVGPPLNSEVIRIPCGGMHFVAFDAAHISGNLASYDMRLAEHVDYIGTSQWLDPSENAIGEGREFRLRTDSTAFLTTAVRQGAGRALFPNFWHLLVDGLDPVDDSPSGFLPVYISFNKGFTDQAEGRQVVDWLKRVLKVPNWFGKDFIPAGALNKHDLALAEQRIHASLTSAEAGELQPPMRVARM